MKTRNLIIGFEINSTSLEHDNQNFSIFILKIT